MSMTWRAVCGCPLVREAEAKGRDAMGRLSRAHASLDAREKSGWEGPGRSGWEGREKSGWGAAATPVPANSGEIWAGGGGGRESGGDGGVLSGGGGGGEARGWDRGGDGSGSGGGGGGDPGSSWGRPRGVAQRARY